MDRVVPAVLAGGVAGSVGRWAISEAGWSGATTMLVVNTLGSFVLGIVIAAVPDRDNPVRLALGIGVCGGLTTFSGLAVDLATRLDAGQIGEAAGMTFASLALGLVAFLGGRTVAP
ncbi:MAG: CrcB family protein [Actinomycetota bacterium]